jgi:outer membrane protein OmpA-like peptidoglycan-associated protein
MSLNLLDLAKGYITDAAIQKLSGSVGESPSATKSALDGILPAILGGVVSKATSGGGGGLGSVMDLIKGANSDGDLLGKVTGILKGSGGDNNSLASLGTMGSWLTDSIFGDKAKNVVDSISANAGIKKESSMSLMSMAGPLLMGVLGKQMAGGMGASGLMSLLSGQSEHIQAALPTGLSGLTSMLGLSAVGGNIGKSATDAFGKASGAIGSVGGKLGDAAGGVGGAINGATGGGMPKWLLPIVGLLVAGGLIWFLMKNCGGDKIAESATAAMDSSASMAAGAAGAVVSVADSAGSVAAGAATAATGAVADAANALGAFFKKKLPDGIELNIPENGVENKLIGFIEDKSKAVDKTTWFSFDRLEFETGKSVLKASSQEQLANIAAVLKAFPNVNIKLGGYTDNTGNAASNMKLSDARAKSTVKALETLGVAAARLESEGYGDQHPIGDNTTAEGRQKNRRIEVRVTKK